MTEPVESTLRRAAGEPARPFDMDAVLERTHRARRRRRVARATALGLALLVAVGIGVVLAEGIGRVDPTMLEVPSVGDVSGDFLEDGTPVWVVHRPDGEVLVLRADDDPRSPGSARAYLWCPAGRRFESLLGASWTAEGLLLGGPASEGLARYEIRRRDDAVEVVDSEPEPQGRADPESRPIGLPWCERGPGSVVHPAWAPERGVTSGPG